jgi:glycine/D-amino acid oxidase-like deaminating enzyme
VDLKSLEPFSAVNNGLLTTFPSIERDERCDVAVIGAGITGALIADALTSDGLNVVVLDKREASHGSTCASTGLLQYEIDLSLSELIERHGEQHAVRAYRLCAEAITRIESLVSELDDHCEFQRRPSCYIASRPKDVPALREEAALRQRHGFDVRFLEESEVAERFRFSAAGAIWSTLGGEIDAYRLTYRLLSQSVRNGGRVHDRTEVTKFEPIADGWRLETDRGRTITAAKLIFATGYEVDMLPRKRLVKLNSTFVAISQPLDSFPGWPGRCLVWESARPYFYARTTHEGRILIGGEDEKFRNAAARDALVDRKARRLQERFTKLFPDIPFESEYAWAGTFAETTDGLAYIGSIEEFPNAWFALGYGGNGITYSVIAADLLRDFVCGRPNPDAAIFAFDRHQ